MSELLASNPKFARGAVRAEVRGEHVVRIEYPVTMSKGRNGFSLHPNTARALGEWLISLPIPTPETTEGNTEIACELIANIREAAKEGQALALGPQAVENLYLLLVDALRADIRPTVIR